MSDTNDAIALRRMLRQLDEMLNGRSDLHAAHEITIMGGGSYEVTVHYLAPDGMTHFHVSGMHSIAKAVEGAYARYEKVGHISPEERAALDKLDAFLEGQAAQHSSQGEGKGKT